jgi:hypothetical protein
MTKFSDSFPMSAGWPSREKALNWLLEGKQIFLDKADQRLLISSESTTFSLMSQARILEAMPFIRLSRCLVKQGSSSRQTRQRYVLVILG